jgi:pentatricopeptide repeat protein
MEDAGLTTDEVACNALIAGYGREGDVAKATQWFNKMQGELGVAPARASHAALISAHLGAGSVTGKQSIPQYPSSAVRVAVTMVTTLIGCWLSPRGSVWRNQPAYAFVRVAWLCAKCT